MDPHLNHESKFLVGISPQYWAYTRMAVMDVLNLKLKDGINWLEPHRRNNSERPNETQYDDENCLLSTPVSKCLLVGHIVYASERKGGSKVYVLDDGTGVIDCVHWSTDAKDPYHLPSLTASGEDKNESKGFEVGEQVRIFGKIDCLATSSHNDRGVNKNSSNTVIREIQIRIIERVEDYLPSEAQHWMDICRHTPISLKTNVEKLGPEIGKQILNRVNLPSVDDVSSAWRVFGANCNCKLSYMEELLYCHCQCTAEPLDPFYRFRDALLQMLLFLQSKKAKKLEFNYKEIRGNAMLQGVAMKEVADENQERHVDRLFLKTFRALRIDGIIHLLDSNSDSYLLITRTWVLEPVARGQSKSGGGSFIQYEKVPRCISRVHNERLRYIQRLILEEPAAKRAKVANLE